MSDNSKQGRGPAFPVPDTDYLAGDPGMTLRDYFAAHAPSHSELQTYQTFTEEGYPRLNCEQLRWAYADAMIAARDA